MTEISKRAEMPRAYEPAAVEARWYQFWLDKGYFKLGGDADKDPFVVIMPPPNLTGDLHIGHAVPATIEDILTRWHRMCGEPTLWLPGVDHAGIAAQVVVERALAAEGKTRHDIGRQAFEARIWQWAADCRRNIGLQHRHLGVSCDWDRETFTLDPGPSHAVRVTFKNLYDKGLIYRGQRIINWCVRCATALSDLEVDHRDLESHLWHLRYPYEDDPQALVTVATTRPETLLGDTAVAVNPEDPRYAGMIGKRVVVPFVERAIPIIADAAVDMGFGTGAVKVTPAHDPVDFEMAARHQLPLIYVIGQDALMTAEAGPYQGQDRFHCRENIVRDLEASGQLDHIEPHTHAVGHCMRCGTVVEPLASLQWFVRTEPLAAPAIAAVNDGRIRIIPERFVKVYLNWMENIRDWCISRQLWWGHRIPVWYCGDCGEVIVATEAPTACPKCASVKLEQDPDVLDTWFSSGLWPHSTLGWPEDTEDLRRFYPTAVMETGYDILFFWVARMIMLGLENTGQAPFHTVYLHGLIRDEKGIKMSKVKGNVLNPLDLIEEYGTDALRFGISTGTTPGNDSKLSRTKMAAARNFANKVWNAGRFVIGSTAPEGSVPVSLADRPAADRWILSQLHRTVAEVTRLLTEFQFGEAQRRIHDFLWGDYCDWYIELAKIRLRAGDAVSPLPLLVHVLEVSLRLLHPFMPFITEELWQHLTARCRGTVSELDGAVMPDCTSIMIAPFPVAGAALLDEAAERVINTVIEIVHALRNIRAENGVAAERWIEASVRLPQALGEVRDYALAIESLARVRPLSFAAGITAPAADENQAVSVLTEAEVMVPLASMVDRDAECLRLEKEIAETATGVARLQGMLADVNFTAKAPAAVVDKQRRSLEQRLDLLSRLRQQLARFS